MESQLSLVNAEFQARNINQTGSNYNLRFDSPELSLIDNVLAGAPITVNP